MSRLAVALLVVLGACTDEQGSSGPPDGYEVAFRDGFADGLDHWALDADFELDNHVGRPAPSLRGIAAAGGIARLTPIEIDGDVIESFDFMTGTDVDLFFTASGRTFVLQVSTDGSLEVTCPTGNNATVADFDASVFHHVDARIDASGANAAIDGVVRCQKTGDAPIGNSYGIGIGIKTPNRAPNAIDNVTFYRSL